MTDVSSIDALTATLAQSTSPLLRSLADFESGTLVTQLSIVKLKGGQTLFAAGEPGDALYLVVFGRLRAVTRDADGERVLGEIGRGESIGEMALLSGEPRSATIYAIRDTELIKLSKASFDSVVARHPAVMVDVSRLLIERYQRVIGDEDPHEPTTLAVVPCNMDVAGIEFTAGVVKALSSGRKVLWMDQEWLRREQNVPGEWSSDNAEHEALAGRLHELERQHDALVYQADPLPSAWTRLCIRQADLVLLVGAGAGAEIHPGIRALLDSSSVVARKELVLLYDSRHQVPCGSAEWLAKLNVASHHHVDPRRPGDYERLMRLVTGRATGLVLGGGGARGLAHIGVLRALEEAGIVVDLVGGTSIGALIGAQHASGWDSARVLAETRKTFVEGGSLNDFTLPMFSLLRGKRYVKILESLFGQRCIEDLPRFYFCVSTNLTRSECMVHRAGPLRKWAAASMAVPGLGPPIFDGRDVLVDGGVLNNLPVDVMRGFCRGSVIASNVSSRVAMRLDREYEDFPSPWRVLLSRLNPFETTMRVPSLASILIRTASLPKPNTDAQRQSADLLFEPPIEGYKLLDWHSFDKIVETGYRSAVVTLETWQRKSEQH